MNKIRFSAFLLTLAVAVISLGYMSSSFAGKKCDEDPAHPSCGGGDDPPGSSAEYTVALVFGAFRFDAVDVTLNKKGNSYIPVSMDPLDIVRPADDTVDQVAWDDVFLECPELFSGFDVGSISAPDSWTIDNGGTNNAGTVGTNIRIQFRDVTVPGFAEADLDLGLIGVIEKGNELPPKSGDPSYFNLTKFSLFGAAAPPTSCKSGTLPMFLPGVLEISRK